MGNVKNTRPVWSGEIKGIARTCGCGYFTVSKVLAGDTTAASDELQISIKRVTAAKLRIMAQRLEEKAANIYQVAAELEN